MIVVGKWYSIYYDNVTACFGNKYFRCLYTSHDVINLLRMNWKHKLSEIGPSHPSGPRHPSGPSHPSGKRSRGESQSKKQMKSRSNWPKLKNRQIFSKRSSNEHPVFFATRQHDGSSTIVHDQLRGLSPNKLSDGCKRHVER